MPDMQVTVGSVRSLIFDDECPVRAASAIVAYADGWLVVQDDSTFGAHLRGDEVARIRLLDPVEGHDSFSSEAGTKHLKPDLEAACTLPDGRTLLLGSGSAPARRRGVVLDGSEREVLDLTGLHQRIATALGTPAEVLNLEGACVVGDRLRWFHRGLPAAGWPSASVDLPLGIRLDRAEPANVLHYELGSAGGSGLAVTDAVAVGEGLVLVSAAAEDSPNAYDDGPVVGSALALLDAGRVVGRAELPRLDGRVAKVEGLLVLRQEPSGVRLLASVDGDDPTLASLVLDLAVGW